MILNTIIEYLVGLLAVQEVANSYFLVLQVLVVLEEIADLLDRVRGNIADVAECVGWINARTRARNQLGVVALVIARFQTSEDDALDVGAGHQLIVHQNNDINRVTIITQCIGNETIIEIVGEWCVQDAVTHESISLLVVFVFDPRILGYFNEHFNNLLFGIHKLYDSAERFILFFSQHCFCSS